VLSFPDQGTSDTELAMSFAFRKYSRNRWLTTSDCLSSQVLRPKVRQAVAFGQRRSSTLKIISSSNCWATERLRRLHEPDNF